MSIQDRRCDTLGVDVGWIGVGCNPLDAREASSLDVLCKEVSLWIFPQTRKGVVPLMFFWKLDP